MMVLAMVMVIVMAMMMTTMTRNRILRLLSRRTQRLRPFVALRHRLEDFRLCKTTNGLSSSDFRRNSPPFFSLLLLRGEKRTKRSSVLLEVKFKNLVIRIASLSFPIIKPCTFLIKTLPGRSIL